VYAIGWLSSQSGVQRFALVALLLLTLPDVFAFHTLLALLRLAERRRTKKIQPTPDNNLEILIAALVGFVPFT
jgi:hypothetical protein